MAELKRTISLNTAIAVVIGGIIGSGIFMKPSAMALELGSPLLLISVWVVAGVITLFGALSNAEIASMFPETGGQYIFFRKMYGGFFGFLYGWAALAVFNTAGNASIAYVCAEYANYFFHLPRLDPASEQSFHISLPGIGRLYILENIGVKSLTIGLILLFTLVNYRSVRFSASVQRWLTALKVAAIGILIFGLLSSSKGSAANMTHTSFTPEGMALLGAYMSAIGGAFWAYDGWNNITFIAGEIQRPRENIPKSLFTGLLTCILVYATLNLAFIYILPIETLAASSFVASDAATIVWGVTGGTLITIMVVLSTLGTTNSNVLATARVTCAWSRDNRLFNGAAKVHRGNFTPGNALLLNAIWSCILILSGSFDMLTSMLVFVSWFFYMMSGIGLFVLRRKMPAEKRAYKVWGYPLIPAIFIVFAAAFLIITLYTDITAYIGGRSDFINSVFGICITLTGIPFYFISRKRKLHIDSSAGERGKQVN